MMELTVHCIPVQIRCFIIMGWAWVSSTLLASYCVMAHLLYNYPCSHYILYRAVSIYRQCSPEVCRWSHNVVMVSRQGSYHGYIHRCGLNFTLKSWAKALLCMSIFMQGPLPDTISNTLPYVSGLPFLSWSIVEVAYRNQKQVSMCASTWVIMAPSLTNTALSLDRRPFWLEGLWFRWCYTQHSHHSHSQLGWFWSVHGHSTVVKCWNMLIWNKNRHSYIHTRAQRSVGLTQTPPVKIQNCTVRMLFQKYISHFQKLYS